jgi:hypothetical protein
LLFRAHRNANPVRPASRLSIKRIIFRTNGSTLWRDEIRKTNQRNSSAGRANGSPLKVLKRPGAHRLRRVPRFFLPAFVAVITLVLRHAKSYGLTSHERICYFKPGTIGVICSK